MSEPNWMRLIPRKQNHSSTVQYGSPTSEIFSPRSEEHHRYDKALSAIRKPRLQHSLTSNANSVDAPRSRDFASLTSSPNPVATDGPEDAMGSTHEDTEITWLDPSIEGIVDGLRVVMMTKPPHEPLGPQYNSSVLHLLEDHSQSQRKLMKAKKKLVECEIRRGQELEKLEDLTERWCIREARYRAEIKRLELLIHGNSKSGMEAVLLARSGSLLDKSTSCDTAGQEDNDEIRTLTLGIEKRKYGENVTDYDSVVGRARLLDMDSDVKISQRLRDNKPIDIGRYNPDREELIRRNNGKVWGASREGRQRTDVGANSYALCAKGITKTRPPGSNTSGATPSSIDFVRYGLTAVSFFSCDEESSDTREGKSHQGLN